MKKNFKTIGLLFIGVISMVSCSKDDNFEQTTEYRPSTGQWYSLRNAALQNQTQLFTATAGTGMINLTSSHGVLISLDGNNLTRNGNPVTGSIDIKFIELFDKGSMLVTNKPTMGIMPNGDKSILISGGEFYINATQGGQQLAISSTILLQVPTNLTGAMDTGMEFWAGDVADEDNLAWEKPGAGGPAGGNTDGAVGFNQVSYNVTFGNFGWTNIDRFYSDPRPKTQILAAVPSGYDNTNSSIYLSVDGEGQNQLAKFDTYNPTTQQFSEHYGQIPIGLQCHIIFATEDNGQWRYAIKAVTTTANAVYTFTLSETVVGSESQMIAAINAIQ
ncbi:MAG: hypothetical protein ABI426_10085 [Flavobacterium sp.]